MRVVFAMARSGFGRNFEATLRLLAAKHEVIVALDPEPDGSLTVDEPLRSLATGDGLVRIVSTVGHRRGSDDAARLGIRLWLDYLRYLEPEYADATRPRERARDRAPLAGRLERMLLAAPAVRRAIRSTLAAIEAESPVPAEVSAWLAGLAPDVVVVTPLVEVGGGQQDIVRAARAIGIPSVLAVASWDNLTMKGGMHVVPDVVTVWNEAQRREAADLHGAPAERVVVTGAVAYDQWLDWPDSDRNVFMSGLGLDPARPLVVYVGSSGFIAPDEGAFVVEWARAVRARLPSVQVLVRPHPTNPLGAAHGALSALEDVVIHPEIPTNPTDPASRDAYFQTLTASAAIVGINTSALIEGAVIGRPVLTVLEERYHATQTGLMHFAHLLPENGGPLNVGVTLDAHIDQLATCVTAGDADGRGRRFVESFVRPAGIGRAASPLLVAAIEQSSARLSPAASSRPSRLAARVGLAALRPAARLWGAGIRAGSRS